MILKNTFIAVFITVAISFHVLSQTVTTKPTMSRFFDDVDIRPQSKYVPTSHDARNTLGIRKDLAEGRARIMLADGDGLSGFESITIENNGVFKVIYRRRATSDGAVTGEQWMWVEGQISNERMSRINKLLTALIEDVPGGQYLADYEDGWQRIIRLTGIGRSYTAYFSNTSPKSVRDFFDIVDQIVVESVQPLSSGATTRPSKEEVRLPVSDWLKE